MIILAAIALILGFAQHVDATELRILVPPPTGYAGPVSLQKGELLVAWQGGPDGGTEAIPLVRSYEGSTLVITVPLDAGIWRSQDASQLPDFAYVYLEFDDFVPVRSDRFYWAGAMVPAPQPARWKHVDSFAFSFRGGTPVIVRSGEEKEITLIVRRPVSRQLRVVDQSGAPVTDATVYGGMFWSANNHCSFPSGLEPLFSNIRPNADGVVTIPDGDFEYGIALRTDHHLSVIQPPTGFPLFLIFTTYLDSPELLVRVRRHTRMPLSVRITVGGKPAAGVAVGAYAAHAGCGIAESALGRTNEGGVLQVPDFYPEETDRICIADDHGKPLKEMSPGAGGAITMDFPSGTRFGACYQN